jgi:hypothetical protein
MSTNRKKDATQKSTDQSPIAQNIPKHANALSHKKIDEDHRVTCTLTIIDIKKNDLVLLSKKKFSFFHPKKTIFFTYYKHGMYASKLVHIAKNNES